MRTIWKWTLAVKDQQTISLPEGAKILSIQIQGDGVQLWANVDPDKPKEPRVIAIFGTGHPLPDESNFRLEYISTFQLDGGLLVFHAFEVIRS